LRWPRCPQTAVAGPRIEKTVHSAHRILSSDLVSLPRNNSSLSPRPYSAFDKVSLISWEAIQSLLFAAEVFCDNFSMVIIPVLCCGLLITLFERRQLSHLARHASFMRHLKNYADRISTKYATEICGNHFVIYSIYSMCGSIGSRVVSVLDSGAGPGFKSEQRRCRLTVLGKLFTPIVPLFAKQRNW